ncbi:MAG: peptidase M, neutral zinc metallopeptidase site [Calothrix sp. MO_167.B42]|nr:peptidase M, neutral zinc metallopeptidase site [Calothrix sp. MO_167.B42]
MSFLDIFSKREQTIKAIGEAQQLAQKKQLRSAVILAESTISNWSSQSGFWQEFGQKLLLGDILDQFQKQLKQWHKQVAQADKLIAQAKAFLKQDTGDPLITENITNGIFFYQRCTKILQDNQVSQATRQCQRELEKRQQFQKLVQNAEYEAENRFYQQAIAIYDQAEKLYVTKPLKKAIATCKTQVEAEKIYDSALQTAKQAANEGKLRSAITLLSSALGKFHRADGIELIEKLQRTVKGREKYRAGLEAEKAGNLLEAASFYQSAKVLLPEPTECQLRLGIVAIKTKEWADVLSHLKGLDVQPAPYLRGFALAQQGYLQAAYKEWQGLSNPEITAQKETLKTLSQRQRLLAIKNIQQLIENEHLEQGKTASAEFIEKFGADPLVEGNLNEHIQPRLEAAIWQNDNWEILTHTVEQAWILDPNCTTLHNWLVANYYNTQNSTSNISELIIALPTALANLTYDPAVKDVPWLGNQVIELKSVSLELQRRLEEIIDTFKEQNTNEYFQLRDYYRLDMVALSLMGNPPKEGMKVKGVFVTPGCYSRFLTHWQNIIQDSIDPSQNILRSLYTPWGLAVAACVQGDTKRGIKLKPSTKPVSRVETFAQKFVAYHEGCYQLQEQKWREAIIPLKLAQSQIQVSIDWQQEIDRLCGLQRQGISEFKEHLEFAQFWDDICKSQAARSYLAEYKAEEIREKLVNQQITNTKALEQLEKIKQIDTDNPIVADLIERIKVNQEMEEIEKLLKNNQFEDAVRCAKQSSNQRIRNVVAEICLDILIKGIQQRSLSIEVVQQLGKWAYEICPDEPAFQEIYRSLNII